MTKNSINVDAVKASKTAQQRADGIVEATVAQYVADAKASDGWPFPPIVVYGDSEGSLWISDGFHRHTAALRLGIKQIPAEIREGTERDAILHACSANATHGLPRTNADKRKAVTTLLADSEWAGWSDREIARRCHVHHELVGTVRKALAESASAANAVSPRRKTADGRTMNTSGIRKSNRKRAKTEPASKSDTTTRAKPTKKATKKKVQPKVDAQQVFHGIGGMCSDLRKVDLPRQDLFVTAQILRDTLIWILKRLPNQDASSIRQKFADTAIGGPKDA